MTQQLTETEAVEILRLYCGWRRCRNDGEGNYIDDERGPYWRNPDGQAHRSNNPPSFDSRDALQPVLEKMTAEEWEELHVALWPGMKKAGPQTIDVIKFLLTLPVRTLCLAVAAAIKECAK